MVAVELKTALKETEGWIDDLMERLGWHDRERTYRVLIAGLHAVRDSLPWGTWVPISFAAAWPQGTKRVPSDASRNREGLYHIQLSAFWITHGLR